MDEKNMKKILFLLLLSLFLLTSCSQMETYRRINNAQEIRIRQLEGNNDELKKSYYEEKTRRANEGQSYKIKIKGLEAEVSRLENAKTSKEKDLELSQTNLQLQVQTLKDEKAKIESDSTNQINQLTADNTQLKQQNDDLNNKLTAATTENTALKQKNEQQKAKIDTLTRNNKDAQIEIANLKQQISNKESEIKTLTASLIGKEKSDATIEKKITELEKTIKTQAASTQVDTQKYAVNSKNISSNDSELDTIYDLLKSSLAAYTETKNLQVNKDNRGVVIVISANLLFPPDSTVVKDSSKDLFSAISSVLKKYPETRVNVEGHTDDQPVEKMPFADNWALSSARATNVLRYMVDNEFIEADRIKAIAAGASFPLYPNTSSENRSKNRRVEIVIYY